VLEALCGDDTEEIAPQLARHFEEAGIVDKAIHYLHQAGTHATRMTANLEAIGYLRLALGLLGSVPAGADRDRLELALQVALQAPLIATQGWGGGDVGAAAERAFELCERLGDDSQRVQVMWLLASFCSCAGDLPRAVALGEQMLELAERVGDQNGVFIAHWCLGWAMAWSGRFPEARQHLEWVVERYDPDRHHWMTYVYGEDPGVVCLSHLVWTLVPLGHVDQATRRSEAALEWATALDHPLSTALALWGTLALEFVEPKEDDHLVRRLLAVSEEHGLPVGLLVFKWAEGVRLFGTGHAAEARTLIGEALEISRQIGFKLMDTLRQTCYGVAQHAAGETPEAVATFDEALQCARSWGERAWEAKIHLQKGIVLRDTEALADAEQSFLTAIDIARGQQARLYELQAATALARLWQDQGKRREARELLGPVYDWFTEGLDTTPLEEARELLNELEDRPT